MRSKLLIIFGIVIIFGCKKEPLQPYHNFYLNFEKDGEIYEFEGSEISYKPTFGAFTAENIRNSGTTFTLKSWCSFTESEPEIHDASFYVEFFQFDTSHVFSQHGIDKMFFEGIQNVNPPSFVVIPSNLLSHAISLRYITDYPNRETFDHYDCDDSDLDYFEITKIEKLESDGKVNGVIIEANFDVVLCTTNGDKVEFKNGNLRYLYDL